MMYDRMYARVHGKNVTVATIDSFFPQTTFLHGIPDEQFLALNGLNKVLETKPFDYTTQKLEVCAPYAENGQVYCVRVVALTQEEIDALAQSVGVVTDVAFTESASVSVSLDPVVVTAEIQALTTTDIQGLSTTQVQNLTTSAI